MFNDTPAVPKPIETSGILIAAEPDDGGFSLDVDKARTLQGGMG